MTRRSNIYTLASALLIAAAAPASAAVTADQVLAYNPGDETVRTNSAAALGEPDGIVGEPGNPFTPPQVLSPFSPGFETDEIVRMRGEGAGITLRLSHFAEDVAGPELGILSNVGLIDADYPNGEATDPAGSFSQPRQALVEVSEDGQVFVSLGTFVFDVPADYYTDVTDPYSQSPGASPADLGKPFTGSLSDFDGLTYAGMKTLLDGSIGGNWIDIGPSGLSKVGYVRFTTVAGNGYDFVLDSLLVADDAAGEVVPEPMTGTLMLLAGGMLVGRRGRRSAMDG